MNCLMENHNTLHNVPTRYEGRLGRLDHFLSNQSEPISYDLCENFKTRVNEANQSILLNSAGNPWSGDLLCSI
jgi:hypothetical protein